MTTLTSHAPPIPSPLHAGILAELVRDNAWKDGLGAKIEEGMSTMVEDTKKTIQAALSNDPSFPERREGLTQDYQRAVGNLRALAEDTFAVGLECERQVRLWAAGVDMTPWNNALVEVQQDIMAKVTNFQKGVQSPNTTEPPSAGQEGLDRLQWDSTAPPQVSQDTHLQVELDVKFKQRDERHERELAAKREAERLEEKEAQEEAERLQKQFDEENEQRRLEEQKEARRIQEETILKTDHLQQQEDDLKSRERATKAKDAEPELLIPKTRKSATLLKLRSIFLDVTAKHYRRLLQCDGRDAQTILDTFQSVSETGLLFIESFSFVDKLLDTDAAAPDRGQLIVAMRRLSAKTQLYPRRYLIDGPMELVHEHPVDGGNFADIYKANFQGNLTCLKVIRVRTAALVQRMAKVYAREAILWGQLSHPNLLPFYGLHTFRESQIAFVAPWAEKGNLCHYLEKEPNANRVLLCADTAAGVEYLHANGVVHGDLKAVNILVDGFGRACLSDFGLSGVADSEIIKWTTQSSAASKGGTARWQAPELHDPDIEDIHNSKESDVFGWASTSYEVFTGKRPFFEINSETRVIVMILRGYVPTQPSLDDKSWTERGLTEKIWMLLNDCWKTHPSERPDISVVKSRIDNEKPAEDPRPPGQWGSGLAMRFRNAQEASIPNKRPSLEDLDVILSRVVDECEAGDDGVE
ncbi:hypothetical protein DXG01_002386 [Tephrocybe rancida]|nr:hypothetical protein DXG01_002386 [Tephrocybe rancida]